MQTSKVTMLDDKQANTLEPYKKMFKKAEFENIAPAPMINIPVPKKKQLAIEIPKNLLKIIFKKVYKLAQPRLIIIFDNIAKINEGILTSNDACKNIPEAIVPIK